MGKASLVRGIQKGELKRGVVIDYKPACQLARDTKIKVRILLQEYVQDCLEYQDMEYADD